jgi:hypothetical protein
LRTRQKRRIDLKGGVLGGGTDEGQQTRLDMGQKSILLRLVESVHLIHKNKGSFTRLRLLKGFGLLDRFADVFDTAQDGTDHDELRVKGPGH